MKDSDIRKIILSDLDRRFNNDPGTMIIEELGLCQGEARIDIAIVNGSIHGFEIKSNQDTLKRLTGQVAIYNRVLDKITLIVGNEHIDDALDLIPEWWGVIEARETEGKMSLHKFRADRKNPCLDSEAIVQLIWREEALDILRKRNLHKGFVSKSKWVLWDRITEKLSPDELREEVRNSLKSRICWRSAEKQ